MSSVLCARASWLTLVVALCAACSTDQVAPTDVGAAPEPVTSRLHNPVVFTLASNTPAAVTQWLTNIRSACVPEVRAVIEAGTFTLARELDIGRVSTCQISTRTIEIVGRGATVTRLEQMGTKTTSVGATTGRNGFNMLTPGVGTDVITIDSLALVGSTIGDANLEGGNGIAFFRNTSGAVRDVAISGFGTTGVKIDGGTNITLEFNTIYCNNGAGARGIYSMGISAQPATVSTPGSQSGLVFRANYIYNCAYEGIILNGISQALVTHNRVSCPNGQCMTGITLSGIQQIVGGGSCQAWPTDSNVVQNNLIYRTREGILLNGYGPVRYNSILANGVDSASVDWPGTSGQHGIMIAPQASIPGGIVNCPLPPNNSGRELFSDNTIQNNNVYRSHRAGFWIGGNRTSLFGNNADHSQEQGFVIDSDDNYLVSNIAQYSGYTGFFIDGNRNRLGSTTNWNEANGAYHNSLDGVRVRFSTPTSDTHQNIGGLIDLSGGSNTGCTKRKMYDNQTVSSGCYN